MPLGSSVFPLEIKNASLALRKLKNKELCHGWPVILKKKIGLSLSFVIRVIFLSQNYGELFIFIFGSIITS